MKTYDEFHGEVDISNIGKRLREIAKNERNNFKILTGYGSTCGKSKSKESAIKALTKMKKEGIIKGFLPGDINSKLIDETSPYYEAKNKYSGLIKKDEDFKNDGIIFVFIK